MACATSVSIGSDEYETIHFAEIWKADVETSTKDETIMTMLGNDRL